MENSREIPKFAFLTDSGTQVKKKTRDALKGQSIPKIVSILNENGFDFELCEEQNSLSMKLGQENDKTLHLNLDFAFTLTHPTDRTKRKSRAGKSKKSETTAKVPNLFE